jgi:hypothetical protein
MVRLLYILVGITTLLGLYLAVRAEGFRGQSGSGGHSGYRGHSGSRGFYSYGGSYGGSYDGSYRWPLSYGILCALGEVAETDIFGNIRCIPNRIS